MLPKNKYLIKRANIAAVKLINSLVEINNLRWYVYNTKKDKAKLKNFIILIKINESYKI